jgi:hypothetical protein
MGRSRGLNSKIRPCVEDFFLAYLLYLPTKAGLYHREVTALLDFESTEAQLGYTLSSTITGSFAVTTYVT